MDVLGLTSFDQIRGVLAVSPADLPDALLGPMALEDDLSSALATWLPTWEATRDGADTEAQLQLRLYAKYQAAATVAVSGQNFTLKQYTDGANTGQRSDKEGYQMLRQHLEERAGMYRDRLERLLEPASTSTFVSAMGAVSPSRDPITEGR